MAAANGWEVLHSDVVTAFLNPSVDYKHIIIKPPKGFEEFDENGKPLLWKLKKGLYGLKQAAMLWNKELTGWFEKHGYEVLKSDRSICKKTLLDGSVIIMTTYVDDIIGTGSDVKLVQAELDLLEKSFKMTHMGPIKWYQNMVIKVDTTAHRVEIHQGPFVEQALETFGLTDAHPKSTPLPVGANLLSHAVKESTTNIRTLVGKLIWVSGNTRPDITDSVGKLSRMMHRAAPMHESMGKHILRYLKGTKTHGIRYERPQNLDDMNIAIGWIDASWGDWEGRSTMGGVVFMNGGPIYWFSKVQEIVALSSVEAEIVGLAAVIQAIFYVRGLLGELGAKQNKPTKIYIDNHGAFAYGNNPGTYTGRRNLRHLDIRYYFIKDAVEKRIIELFDVRTGEQIADIMTKSLCPKAHKANASKLIQECGE
jgi:hypothetical protein